jgi:hypothetical protein
MGVSIKSRYHVGGIGCFVLSSLMNTCLASLQIGNLICQVRFGNCKVRQMRHLIFFKLCLFRISSNGFETLVSLEQ